MKKIIIFILLIFISIDTSYACKIKMLAKDIPSDFKINCYEKIGNLNPDISGIDLGNEQKCIGRNTFKVNSSEKIDTFISGNQIIPHKLYNNSGDNINYKIDLDGNINYLKDENYKTFLILDTSKNNKVNIEFDEKITSNTFDFIFNYSSDYFRPDFNISEDGSKYFPVSQNNIKNYDFKYLEIFFHSTVKHITLEKIEISELNFKSTNYQYLIKTLGDITAYSNNLCNNNYVDLSNNDSEYNVDKNTISLDLELINNPNFDTLKQNDSDNDGVDDKIDNCLNIYNPIQKDTNGNGKGDMCSDDDNDRIIGEKDNCLNIYNPDQKDINGNLVGDICEFDKDNDGIFDQLDNCINKANPEQKDTDNDGIGDICDNSIYYNPSQKDENQNGIGDITEQKEKQLKQNDTDSDGIIDYKDNCKEIANLEQEDYDKDGIGDLCDNSPYYNPDQLDKNKNGIGDISEDSDNDGIEGIEDNCINIANIDQKDTDNDGIGDLCEDDDYDNILAQNDNCPFVYNPEQIDIDKDGIGDKCDETDNRYIESNSTFFILLLVFIVIIFGGAIFLMIRKLK